MNTSKLKSLAGIVSEVETKTGYKFSTQEIFGVLLHTVRKCKINKKDADYVPILFENELRDHVARSAVNCLGFMNYLNNKKEKEGFIDVRDLSPIQMSGWLS